MIKTNSTLLLASLMILNCNEAIGMDGTEDVCSEHAASNVLTPTDYAYQISRVFNLDAPINPTEKITLAQSLLNIENGVRDLKKKADQKIQENNQKELCDLKKQNARFRPMQFIGGIVLGAGVMFLAQKHVSGETWRSLFAGNQKIKA